MYLAYLDPGSGSFIFQILIGVALTLGVAIRVFWSRIVSFFRKTPKTEAGTAPPTEPSDGE